jgi:hypothetical protein
MLFFAFRPQRSYRVAVESVHDTGGRSQLSSILEWRSVPGTRSASMWVSSATRNCHRYAAVPVLVRHAAVSLWLNAGLPATEVADRAGHSVDVLLKVYAKCIDGQRGHRQRPDR